MISVLFFSNPGLLSRLAFNCGILVGEDRSMFGAFRGAFLLIPGILDRARSLGTTAFAIMESSTSLII